MIGKFCGDCGAKSTMEFTGRFDPDTGERLMKETCKPCDKRSKAELCLEYGHEPSFLGIFHYGTCTICGK